MKKLRVIINGNFEIVDEKHNIESLPKSIKEACNKLAKDYEGLINFEIGQTRDNKWVVGYYIMGKKLETARANIKILINRIEFIFNSKTKEIKRTESIIYG